MEGLQQLNTICQAEELNEPEMKFISLKIATRSISILLPLCQFRGFEIDVPRMGDNLYSTMINDRTEEYIKHSG